MDRIYLLYIVAMAAQYATEHGDLAHVLDACGEVFIMLTECERMAVIRETDAYRVLMAFVAGEERGESGNGKHGKEVWE